MTKFLLFSILALLISASCASYNYETLDSDRTLSIKADNLADFQVFSIKSSSKLQTASSGVANPRLQGLKKDDLSLLLSHPNYEPQQIILERSPRAKALIKDIGLSVFTFGIPIVVDLFKSDFYKISAKTKTFNVHFEFKQSFMSDEFTKISNSKNPSDFEEWISKYPKSVRIQEATDRKDSLELTIALSKELESAIDDFIATHTTSTYLGQATQIKAEMIAARELFEVTKKENTVKAYENFLSKYPRSLHNTEAHKKLTDAAEKVAVASSSSSSMILYMKSYLIPYSSFLNATELDVRKDKISRAIDGQLIKENVKTDTKKTYEYYSNLWKAYNKVKAEGLDTYLKKLDQTYAYQTRICDLLFTKVKEANTQEKQTALISKIKNDFPNLDVNDALKNPIITTLENAQKSSGTVKLFNVGYIPYYFDNMSERDALKGSAFYNYKGTDYQSLKGISYEEVSLSNGQLSGLTKCFSASQLDFSLNMGASGPKDISYYRSGSLVKTVFFPVGAKSYYYEYENGNNLTLQELDKKINEGIAYQKAGNYDQAISVFVTALKNDFSPSLPQNIKIKNSISSTKVEKGAYIKKKEEIAIAEEKRRKAEEAERNRPIGLKDYYQLWDYPSQFIGRNISMIVWQTPGADDYVIYQREQRETKKGATRNNMFKGTQYYIDPSQLQTESYYLNWKHFTEATTEKKITVNIPDRFFDQNLIPHNTGSSYYLITVNVYPMRESRGAGQKGKYNDGGGSTSEVTYELIDIKRYNP